MEFVAYQKEINLIARGKRCNNMLISWLLHSVDKGIAETLLYYETTTEIWSDLKLRFGHSGGARLYQGQKELFYMSQGSLSISAYFI